MPICQWEHHQRTLTIVGSITVRLISSLTAASTLLLPTFFCNCISAVFLSLTVKPNPSRTHIYELYLFHHIHIFTISSFTTPYPENTYLLSKGKYHCMAGIQFDWFGLGCFATYKEHIFLFGRMKSSQTGVQLYRIEKDR